MKTMPNYFSVFINPMPICSAFYEYAFDMISICRKHGFDLLRFQNTEVVKYDGRFM